jgi:ATP-dependent DNA ligase
MVKRAPVPMPGSLKSKPPSGDWLHEIKYDGYRIQIHINKGRKKVYTRNGLDWTKRAKNPNYGIFRWSSRR